MSNREAGIHTHQEWKGMTQPVGLVVEPIVLDRFGIFPERNINILSDLQRRLDELFEENDSAEKSFSSVKNLRDFFQELLGWQEGDLISANDFHSEQLKEVISFSLEDYEETLKPDWIVPNPKGIDNGIKAQILIKELPTGMPFDHLPKNKDGRREWEATPQQRIERLLKESEHPIGILWNGIALRLIYAPRGESSGHLTFPLEPMTSVDGRPMIAALEMLLGPDRLFEGGASDICLRVLMEQSRKEQNEVSTRLAEQVLDALWILVRGFDQAERQAKQNGKSILRDLPTNQPSHIYGGLITVLLRLVFLLYAEDEELMPKDSTYGQYYSVSRLAQKLRQDRAIHQGAMEGRRGAWATLLSLFRLVYDGGGPTPSYLPARHGELFDPDTYPFLEGRCQNSSYEKGLFEIVPGISDDVIEQVLTKLLILDGQILSYRALDVEQIGSVYEAIMGFTVNEAKGPSLGIIYHPPRQKIAITFVINSDELLKRPGAKREKWLRDEAGVDLKLPIKVKKSIRESNNLSELCQAFEKKLSPFTPRGLQTGSLILQPTEERRRSGSHYTPRELTEPIIVETFRPWLERYNFEPSAQTILSLSVCDPAMGSGAFLVETCRFLAKHLVSAWDRDGFPTELDETFDKDNYARRLIAQNCLYGVDKNSFAVSLAKLSLWLTTLSKDLPFTFVDHALKCGDSLIGLSAEEIQDAHKNIQLNLINNENQFLNDLSFDRQELFSIDNRDDKTYIQKSDLLAQQSKATENLREAGDLIIAAFFDADNVKSRSDKQELYLTMINGSLQDKTLKESIKEIRTRLATGPKGIIPFYWDIEFPEVFSSKRSGFDVFVGNPPFAGDVTFTGSNKKGYFDFLKTKHLESGGRCDLSAFFFRKGFQLLKENGIMGLIATNSIAQGDTRYSGLRWICLNKGTIFSAKKRYKWPGVATVVISIVHIIKGEYKGNKILDKKQVKSISAYLIAGNNSQNPKTLSANENISFKGSMLVGKGFLFSDDESANDEAMGVPSSIDMMNTLLKKNTNNNKVIFPYIGGEELNDSPLQSHNRYVVDFRDYTEEECRRSWPEVMNLLELKVKPERTRKNTNGSFKLRKPLPQRWWQHGDKRPALYMAISNCENVMVICRVSTNFSVGIVSTKKVFSDSLTIFNLRPELFAVLQSNIHEDWARLFGSSLGDGLRYTHTSCLETFPFPKQNSNNHEELKEISDRYIEYRKDLMIKSNKGLTRIYNLFHTPQEQNSKINYFRDLHTEMNKVVLKSYGWDDISIDYGFVPDYLEVEDESIFSSSLQDRIKTQDFFFQDPDEAHSFERQLQTQTSSKRKPSWRYRWSNETREEIISRLLQLNSDRHSEEEAKCLYKNKKPLFSQHTKNKNINNSSIEISKNEIQMGLGLEK